MAFLAHAIPAVAPQPHYQSFGYCDSYFVENHDDDDGTYARAAVERERLRNVAKQRQRSLARDLSMVTADQYQEDILDHMQRMENETMPDLASIEIQTEIQWYMRPYLMDFLVEAHHAFQLLPETLHLAINLLDRYCSRRVVYKRHYQLVGCSCLLIAAKYGDRKERVPTVRELRSMCCALFDEEMFWQMEWHVLATLQWVIGHPTVTSFLEMALTEVKIDPVLEHMTWYITEIALYHKEFIPVRPSIMARSALELARQILGRPQIPYNTWTSRYDPQVVLSLSQRLDNQSQALARKYASHHFSSVATQLDMFLQQQAALAQQSLQRGPILDDLTSMMDVDPTISLQIPQTPQKPGFAHGLAGMLTPPITPDKDYVADAVYGGAPTTAHPHTHTHVHAHGLVSHMPVSPTVVYDAAGQQYIAQPQFIQS